MKWSKHFTPPMSPNGDTHLSLNGEMQGIVLTLQDVDDLIAELPALRERLSSMGREFNEAWVRVVAATERAQFEAAQAGERTKIAQKFGIPDAQPLPSFKGIFFGKPGHVHTWDPAISHPKSRGLSEHTHKDGDITTHHSHCGCGAVRY